MASSIVISLITTGTLTLTFPTAVRALRPRWADAPHRARALRRATLAVVALALAAEVYARTRAPFGGGPLRGLIGTVRVAVEAAVGLGWERFIGEDGAFIGSRAIVVEGVRIGKEAVLGANVVLTASTKIIDVSGPEPKEMRGYVPPRSVVIPGTLPKKFPAGEYGVPCALIIGQRKESTDRKTSLNEALREHNVAV